MGKNKLKNLVHYTIIFFLPLLILLICICSTFAGIGSNEVYTSLSFNLESGFTSFYNIIKTFDILSIETYMTDFINVMNSSYTASIYFKTMCSWFGYMLIFTIIHLCYDICTFVLQWALNKVGGLK